MSNYAGTIKRPARTLTEVETTKLLRTSGVHRDGFRDHVIMSVALATGLREHEILALNVGDVSHDGCCARHVTLRVFKRSSKESAQQETNDLSTGGGVDEGDRMIRHAWTIPNSLDR
jgi:integrase/recombinase XerC